jgi:hypothetical protein
MKKEFLYKKFLFFSQTIAEILIYLVKKIL